MTAHGKLVLATMIGLLAVSSMGCFSPDYGTSPFACGPGGSCPSGYTCYGGVCRTGPVDGAPSDTLTPGDVPPPSDMGTDVTEGPLPDMLVGALRVRVVESLQGPASCPPDEAAVGGGVSCKGVVTESYLMLGGGWQGACLSQAPDRVWAYCVPRVLVQGTKFDLRPGNQVAEALCPAETVVLGGGCKCNAGFITADFPTPNGWQCECSIGLTEALATCFPADPEGPMNVTAVRDNGPTAVKGTFADCPPGSAAIGGGCQVSGSGFKEIGSCGMNCYQCLVAAGTGGPSPADTYVLCLDGATPL